MNVDFRLANVDDVDLLADFMREYYEFDHLAFDSHAARASLRKILSDDSFGNVWLILLDGNPIGYVVLTLGFSLMYRGRDAFVDEFYIRADHRGLGIGRKALEFVEGVCRSLEVRALHLEVERDNAHAQAVYRKFGFEDHAHYLMTKWIAS